jgi:hypothetical protein
MKFRITAALFFVVAFAHAQTQFIRKDSVPVFVNSQQLDHAWTGGINYAQFSEIDLDQDGILDLFVFDRAGNKISTFINTGTPNQVAYVAAMQYVSKFPRLHDWALLRDYNCDGKMDIFTSNASMILVYKNISTLASGLQFQLITPSIFADLEPNSTHNTGPINVSWIDIPAIRDVDGDGDLDILNFGVNAIQVEFYKNRSQELFASCDSLNYTLETLCWGEFIESQLNSTLGLNTPCSAPPINENNNHSAMLHAGSCLECINTDGDNDLDLLVGDLSNVNINLVRNGGSSSYALADSIDIFYPGYDTVMALEIFGCGFHLDVDNDGMRDILFSPNALNTSENYKSVWYYHNTGTNSDVQAHFIQRNFLQEKMIEVGEGAYPVFFDFDNDGDEDLFVGTKGYYNSSGIADCMLKCYENTGTTTSPVFSLFTSDFAGIFHDMLNIRGIAPTFGDMDGDGDKDMIVGDVNGELFYFRKDPGSDTNFVLAQAHYMGIDVGTFAAPQIVDVDRDGKNDLLIGEQTGNVNYYHNDGTNAVPVFTTPVTPLFGNVIVTQTGFTTGYSTPMLYNDSGNYVLLVGSERGFLFRFDNIDGNLTGTFTLTDSLYVSSYEGGRIAPAAADVNSDGMLDVVIGNIAGGVSLFYGDNSVGVEELSIGTQFDMYPNPASEQITFEISEQLNGENVLAIFDLAGKKIMQEKITGQKTMIATAHLPNGIYICSFTNSDGFTVSKKLVISR